MNDLYISHVRRKCSLVNRQIELLLSGDFPYENPKRVLGQLKRALDFRLGALGTALEDLDSEAVRSACKEINGKIVEYHPILGFILRSTNLRNAFEIYDPLQRLTRTLLGENTYLVLSSEWQFSPFTYPYISDDLPSYVFVGFPVSEAGNALILPLAGHELGHSVWRRAGVNDRLKSSINQAVFDQFDNIENRKQFPTLFDRPFDLRELFDDSSSMSTYFRAACGCALRQSEEIFCDSIGIRLFGQSFVEAFSYLISPGLGGARSPLYPPAQERTMHMRSALRKCGFGRQFTEDEIEVDELPYQSRISDQFVVYMADKAVKLSAENIIEEALQYCDKVKIEKIDYEKVDKFSKLMEVSQPVQGAKSIGEIVSAGWTIFRSLGTDQGPGGGMNVEILNHIMFKSLEVYEFEYRLKS